jgi:hypothetical protein
MADLRDIAPSTAVEAVKIGDRFINVRGLHCDGLASILSRFPELGKLLNGGYIEMGPKLVAQFGNAVAPIIAAGCGHLNDEESEKLAATLLIEDQIKLVTAIIGLTFPKGLISFITAIATATTKLLEGAEGEKPVTMRLKRSPSTSPSSSPEDSLPIMQ